MIRTRPRVLAGPIYRAVPPVSWRLYIHMTLVFHQAALGDFVLLWPTLRRLPGRKVVVTHASMAALAAHVLPKVEGHDIELLEFSGMWREDGPPSVSPRVRSMFDEAKRVISFVSSGDDAWAATCDRLIPGAERVYVSPRPPERWGRHVTAWHEERLAEAGVDLNAEATHAEPRDVEPGGPVVIHPGSGSSGKCWPIARYEAVMDRLLAAGRGVRPVLGEVETFTWSGGDLRRWESRYGMVWNLRLTQLADLLREASLFIGNDSGPTHLSAQLGTPTLALFGPTRPHFWHPVGPRIRTLAPATPRAIEWLDVSRVADAAAEELATDAHRCNRIRIE